MIKIRKNFLFEADDDNKEKGNNDQNKNNDNKNVENNNTEDNENDLNEVLESSEAKLFVELLKKEYDKFFKGVDRNIKNEIDALTDSIESIKTKGDYVNFIRELESVFEKLGNTVKRIRADIINNILTQNKEKLKPLNEDGLWKKIELSEFKKTKTYDVIEADIEEIFNDLKAIVPFEKLNIKKAEANLPTLEDDIKDNTFKAITKNEKAEDFLSPVIGKHILDIGDKKKKDDTEKNVTIHDLTQGLMPKLLVALIKKVFPKLNENDKTILKYFNNEATYGDLVVNGIKGGVRIPPNVTPLMSDEGIVVLCAMAVNKFLPIKHESDKADIEDEEDDLTLVLDKLSYKGGKSNAVIHYGQPDAVRKDSQFFELRVSPSVRIKNEKGRAYLVVRTFKSEEDKKLVTKYGKYKSVYETLKLLSDDYDEDNRSGRKFRW